MEKKAMKRSISRVKALFMLYQYDLCNQEVNLDSFDNLLDEAKDDNENNDYDRDFALELYNGVISNLSTIDKVIAINLDNYPLDRLSYVDRNILRIGTFELLYTETPKAIIINEMVELSKVYSETKDYMTSKFNNSVLDKIAKFVLERKDNGRN